jgi:hypothetical protein
MSESPEVVSYEEEGLSANHTNGCSVGPVARKARLIFIFGFGPQGRRYTSLRRVMGRLEPGTGTLTGHWGTLECPTGTLFCLRRTLERLPGTLTWRPGTLECLTRTLTCLTGTVERHPGTLT